jgi:hypothetical protein
VVGPERNVPAARRSTGAPQRSANPVCYRVGVSESPKIVVSESAKMVLDCSVFPDQPRLRGLTRRAALFGAGAAGLALAGCTSAPSRALPTVATVNSDPLGSLYTETLALITLYDQTTATAPLLGTLTGPLREEHRQHAIALASLMGIAAPAISAGPAAAGRSAQPTPVPVPAATVSADPGTAAARTILTSAETTAEDNAVTACLAAPSARSAILASIAASRASHVDALR